MTTTENPTINVEMPAIKPAEIISDSDNLRIARLSFSGNSRNGGYGIQEEIAELGAGGVTLHYIQTNKKSKQFVLLAEEMDTLATEWLKFRHDYFERIAREKAEREAALAALLESCTARAAAVGVALVRENDEWYSLPFAHDSRWFNHWNHSSDYLMLSEVDERLGVIENTLADEAARLSKCEARAQAHGATVAFAALAGSGYDTFSLTFPEGSDLHSYNRRSLYLPGLEALLDMVDRHVAQKQASTMTRKEAHEAAQKIADLFNRHEAQHDH